MKSDKLDCVILTGPDSFNNDRTNSAMPGIEQEVQEITGLISLTETDLKVRRLMDGDSSGMVDFTQVITD